MARLNNECFINVFWDDDEAEQFLGVYHPTRKSAADATVGYPCRLLYRLRVRPKA